VENWDKRAGKRELMGVTYTENWRKRAARSGACRAGVRELPVVLAGELAGERAA